MKSSTKRALSLLLSAALIVASLVIYATLIRPEYDAVRNLRGELESRTNLLSDQDVAITQVQHLIAQYQGVARLGDTLSLALPEDGAVASIMSQLNAIARSAGLLIQSVNINKLPFKPSPAKLTLARGFGILRLELKSLGSYASFKRFLQSLETNIRIMDLVDWKIESVGKPDQDLFVHTLIINTYYQPK